MVCSIWKSPPQDIKSPDRSSRASYTTMSKGYGAIPQAQPGPGDYAQPPVYQGGQQVQYAQPPQYSGYPDENQPLHRPVNNSFGTNEQGVYQGQPEAAAGGAAPQYQQPGYNAPPYQETPPPAVNPHYGPGYASGYPPAPAPGYAPAPPTMQQQSNTVSFLGHKQIETSQWRGCICV